MKWLDGYAGDRACLCHHSQFLPYCAPGVSGHSRPWSESVGLVGRQPPFVGDDERAHKRLEFAAGTGVRARLSDIFEALADPTRRHLVEALAQREASATELASELPVTRQAVAKHLGALRDAGLVDSRKSGRETLYQLNPAPLDQAVAWIASVGGEWDARLERLRAHLRAPRRD